MEIKFYNLLYPESISSMTALALRNPSMILPKLRQFFIILKLKGFYCVKENINFLIIPDIHDITSVNETDHFFRRNLGPGVPSMTLGHSRQPIGGTPGYCYIIPCGNLLRDWNDTYVSQQWPSVFYGAAQINSRN